MGGIRGSSQAAMEILIAGVTQRGLMDGLDLASFAADFVPGNLLACAMELGITICNRGEPVLDIILDGPAKITEVMTGDGGTLVTVSAGYLFSLDLRLRQARG